MPFILLSTDLKSTRGGAIAKGIHLRVFVFQNQLTNPSTGGAAAAPTNHSFNSFFGAFKDSLDATIREISHPAAQAEILCLIPR